MARTSTRSITRSWSTRSTSTPSTAAFLNADNGIWADPHGTLEDEINHHDGGRGVYFQDPSGHYLEIITRPYGSTG